MQYTEGHKEEEDEEEELRGKNRQQLKKLVSEKNRVLLRYEGKFGNFQVIVSELNQEIYKLEVVPVVIDKSFSVRTRGSGTRSVNLRATCEC